MNNIEKAMQVALNAHNSQTDKAGEPYIKHPIRVMQSVESEEEKVVALLHDVVEDSTVSFEDLERRFSDEIVDAVRGVTKKDDESYSDFIERAKENEISREVKKADIRDNLDASRLGELDEEDMKRMEKYRRSLEVLRDE
jgi:guanosine-3',5'-bis(diphosphate) 3'-pyrophosphohydrolase